ncbi:MAG: CHASE sensor domain-containing protein, partial [Hyphomicrobium sp.]
MRSIRTKLAILVATAVASAVMLVCLAFAWTDASRRFSAKSLELHAIATTIATAVSHPLGVHDHANIARTLGSVGRIPGLTYARVADARNTTVQEFGVGIVIARGNGAMPINQRIGPLSALFLETYPVTAAIILGGERIGELTLIADLSELRGAILQSIWSALTAGLLAIALGLLLTLRMQHHITQPIARLTAAIQTLA